MSAHDRGQPEGPQAAWTSAPTAPSLAHVADAIALSHAEIPALLQAEAYTASRLEIARARVAEALSAIGGHIGGGLLVAAVGSYGRLEASACSDLDLICLDLADDDATSPLAADRPDARECILAALRIAFDVPEKTFDATLPLAGIVASIGGPRDSHPALTHRALLLTESTWLSHPQALDAAHGRIFAAYSDDPSTRGRTLGSLANDLHRYYRTVCVDFRHKVAVEAKSWAPRLIKLRHARKIWHLANLALWWAAAAREPGDASRSTARASVDVLVATRLRWPPLVRLATALIELDAAQSVAPILRCYDRYLAAMADPASRAQLETLRWPGDPLSSRFAELRDNADQLDAATAAAIEHVWPRAGAQIVRYGLL